MAGQFLPEIKNEARAEVDSASNLWIEMGGSRSQMKTARIERGITEGYNLLIIL